MIRVTAFLTADNTDVLANSDLASIPRAGMLVIHAASTVNDTLMTITGPGMEPVVRNQPIAAMAADALINKSRDSAYLCAAQQGGRYIIAIDEVTAATICVDVIFLEGSEINWAPYFLG